MVPFQSIKVTIYISPTVSEILTFEILDLENVGQGHEVLLLQWRHSMANIKMKTSFFTCLMFIKIQPVITNVRDKDTHTERTIKANAIGEIADLPKNQ